MTRSGDGAPAVVPLGSGAAIDEAGAGLAGRRPGHRAFEVADARSIVASL